ncbi:hypothetical protein Ate02nite_40960 [Paractinoplanes tereljensis]|uniref:Uncharacterized protein n=1 Tax=Paractinoplanes tereljensis TaxID=571912 RepID=A0A919TT77_9ACTN|nr:hypothetical protein Ate02nite_40960 [Actinoplanes tereljensis]
MDLTTALERPAYGLLCTSMKSTTTQAAARVKLRGAMKFFMADVSRSVTGDGSAQITSRPAPTHPSVAAHTTGTAAPLEERCQPGMRGGIDVSRRADDRPGHD